MKTILFLFFVTALSHSYNTFASQSGTSLNTKRTKALLELKESKGYGPNCWNAALYLLGATDTIRRVSESEFAFAVESPYCKSVQGYPEPGDLISIYDSNGSPFHAMIHLGSETVFHKMSSEPSSPYEIDTIFPALARNGAGLNCKSCKHSIRIFRCNFTETYGDASMLGLTQHYFKLKLSTLEKNLETWSTRTPSKIKQMPEQDFQQLKQKFEDLYLLAKNKSSSCSFDLETRTYESQSCFFWNLHWRRLESMLEGLDALRW